MKRISLPRVSLLSLVPLILAACDQELWVYAPTVDVTVELAEGEQVLAGEAVLTYDPTVLPENEISDALRLTAHGDVELVYPGVPDSELRTFLEPGAQNRLFVFDDCGDAICTTVVPFEIRRSSTEPMSLQITGDAISTTSQRDHLKLMELLEGAPEAWPSDRATLELRFEER